MKTVYQALLAQTVSVARDPRVYQILFLGAFLAYGCLALDWFGQLDRFLIIGAVCIVTQAVFLIIYKRSLRGLLSAIITALGLCLLLKAGSALTLALAAVLAISSKFLIRVKGKHVFNPGNLGIVLAILLTGDAWISPGQWGTGGTLALFFAFAAGMVLLKVGRIDTALTFLLVFAAAEYARTVLFLGWGADVWIHKLLNGSFLLYAFFMITDPRTTPNAPKARILWASLIAILSFLVSNWAYIHTAPIWTLFAVSALTPVFDRVWKAQQFQWTTSITPNLQNQTQ